MESLSIGTIRKEGSKYCLIFSNGRKECFSSKDKALAREKQVKFFKNRDSATAVFDDEEDAKNMAELGLTAEYSLAENEFLYVAHGEDGFDLFLVTGDSDKEKEVVLLSDKDVSEGGAYEEYSKVIGFIMEEEGSDHNQNGETKTFELSEAVVQDQIIIGSHSHTAIVDENNDGKTSEDHGHKHFIYNGYIESANMKIGDLDVYHRHLRKVETT